MNIKRMMVPAIAVCMMLTAVTYLPGCSTGEKTRESAGTGYPSPLTIDLYSSSADKRYVYYVVDRQGVLHYGGGVKANVREPEKVGKLTHEQLRYLWQIIDRYKLLGGSGEIFPRGEKVYEIKLNVGGRRASYGTGKSNLKGLDHLDQALFKMQADTRYGRDRQGDRRTHRTRGRCGQEEVILRANHQH